MMAKIAFLLGPQFEDSEMKAPYDAIRADGHETVIIGLKAGEKLEGKQKKAEYTTDLGIQDADASDYQAVVIPGGSSLKLFATIAIFRPSCRSSTRRARRSPRSAMDLRF